jgi:hypothetical protein
LSPETETLELSQSYIHIITIYSIGSFFRTCMSAYFIKSVAITNRQARDHLAQAQRIKSRRKKETNMKHGTTTDHMARTQEAAPQNLDRLLMTSKAAMKNLHLLAPGSVEEYG